jgi:serine O-acetyltransferase
MTFWETVKTDYQREYQCSTYDGHGRKVFHTVTSPGFQAVFIFRVTHWLYENSIPVIGMILQRFIEIWAGISISPKAKIGPGLVIYHFGGIVINGNAVLGRDCELHHHVTIGNRVPGGPSPELGDRVKVGTGAVIIGGIKIGDEAEIGANAVVLESVPNGAVAVGIPAKVVRQK